MNFGISGRYSSDLLADIFRNQWPISSGICTGTAVILGSTSIMEASIVTGTVATGAASVLYGLLAELAIE